MSINILLCPYNEYGPPLSTVFQTSKLVQTQNQLYFFLKGSQKKNCQKIVRESSDSVQSVLKQLSGRCQFFINLKDLSFGTEAFFLKIPTQNAFCDQTKQAMFLDTVLFCVRAYNVVLLQRLVQCLPDGSSNKLLHWSFCVK